MSKELHEAIDRYVDAFDDWPGYQLMSGREESEVIEIINTCLEKGKDAYDLGYLTLSNDVLY